ncbi:unnamed protein product [Caenorhabditis bovis]|uniref:Uncharacterized protein n=1 Tax=Caenorhabditis bovis TaxID=2654633 RepID=A0A8S1EUE8_9PELO|nr:unnamed protein product [Caenorhabditis bovis]
MALWFSDVSNACLRRLNYPPPQPLDIRVSAADSVVSVILGFVFLIQGLLMEWIPVPLLSTVASFVHVCLLNSMYCFEYFWSSRSVKFKSRINSIESRWTYFVGFGTPISLASSLSGSVVVNGCVFAMLFPFFIISSYKADWKRDYRGATIPKIRIFLPSVIITDFFSRLFKSLVLPSDNAMPKSD